MSSNQTEKWQRMAAIINNAPAPLPDLSQQYRKLVITRLFTENCLVFLLQYCGLTLTTVTTQPALLWFATGTAGAFIFMRGYAILPGIWLGSFLAYYLANLGISIASSCATIFTVQTFLLLWLSQRYVSPTLIFYNVRTFITFLLHAGSVTAIASLILTFVCFTSLRHPVSLPPLWLTWWLANLNGVLLFSTAILTWDFYFPQFSNVKRLSKTPLGLWYGILLLLIVTLSISHSWPLIVLSTLSLFVLTLMISMRFGWCGAIAATFLSALLLSFASFIATPLFSQSLALPTLIFLQLFLGMTYIASVSIALQKQSLETMRG